MQFTIDPAVYTLAESDGRRRGVIVLMLFDGLIWRRFDASSLTTLGRFENETQLGALETWLRKAIAEKAGCPCYPNSTDDARIYYSLKPPPQ